MGIWSSLPENEQDNHGQDVEDPHCETEQVDQTGNVTCHDQERGYYGLYTKQSDTYYNSFFQFINQNVQ